MTGVPDRLAAAIARLSHPDDLAGVLAKANEKIALRERAEANLDFRTRVARRSTAADPAGCLKMARPVEGQAGDYAWTVLRRLVSWANGREILTEHHLRGGDAVYRPDRSEIIWTEADRAAVAAIASPELLRALDASLETGLCPGDLVRPSRTTARPRGAGSRCAPTSAAWSCPCR